MSLPIQPTNGSIETLLSQKVSNVNPVFKAGLTDTGGDLFGDTSNELDANGDVTLRNVVKSIQYWPGGQTGDIDSGTGQPVKFQVYTPDLATDTLLTLKGGRAYWVFMHEGAFLDANPLPGFTEKSVSCKSMTTAGQFLTPGDVPPVVPVGTGWNMVGRHTEEDTTVQQFLAGVSFVSITTSDGSTEIVEARVWTSLLAFLNGIFFDYENAGDLDVEERVTQKLGAFESRFDLTDAVRRGEGFWLFVVTDGVITP